MYKTPDQLAHELSVYIAKGNFHNLTDDEIELTCRNKAAELFLQAMNSVTNMDQIKLIGTLRYIQKQIELCHPGLIQVIKQNVDHALSNYKDIK